MAVCDGIALWRGLRVAAAHSRMPAALSDASHRGGPGVPARCQASPVGFLIGMPTSLATGFQRIMPTA
jgi:hypothetical protein